MKLVNTENSHPVEREKNDTGTDKNTKGNCVFQWEGGSVLFVLKYLQHRARAENAE